MIRFFLICVVGALSVFAQAQPAERCPCEKVSGEAATALKAVWNHPATTDADRQQILRTIESNASGTKTDWDAAATAFFSAKREEPTDFSLLREIGEDSIKAKLIDPQSATIEWPWGFRFTSVRIPLGPRVVGYGTCGIVNAKNRMGGYTGRNYFMVFIYKNKLQLAGIGNNSSNIDVWGLWCQQFGQSLPPPQEALRSKTQTGPAQQMSVADELDKLVKLRDQGVLAPEEFEAAKAKVLNPK